MEDDRNRAIGRWRPSAEALRLGPAALLLESLVRRDDRSLDEALPLVQAVDHSLTRERIEAMLRQFPERLERPRPMPLDDAVSVVRTSDETDAPALANEARRSDVGPPSKKAVEDEDPRRALCIFDVTHGTLSAGAFKEHGTVFGMLRTKTDRPPRLSIRSFGSALPKEIFLRDDGSAISFRPRSSRRVTFDDRGAPCDSSDEHELDSSALSC